MRKAGHGRPPNLCSQIADSPAIQAFASASRCEGLIDLHLRRAGRKIDDLISSAQLCGPNGKACGRFFCILRICAFEPVNQPGVTQDNLQRSLLRRARHLSCFFTRGSPTELIRIKPYYRLHQTRRNVRR